MEAPPDFSDRIAESRAKHIAPAIGAVWIGVQGQIQTVSHGAMPSRGTSHWHIGSCTKAMTATLFARLVDRDLISFDTTLAEALPDLAGQMSPAFRNVRMRALLTHRAGVIRDPADSTFRALRRSNAPVDAQRRFLIVNALREVPRPQIGYSNVGYILLGAVIEKITGRTWESALAHDVFIPLGISRFGFGSPGARHLSGHRRIAGNWQQDRNDNPEAYGPAGRVNLALDEWGRFLRAHLQSTGFLSETARKTLHVAAEKTYAMGWLKRGRFGEPALLHTGSNTAWFAQATLLPARGAAVAIVCNAYDARVEQAVGELTDSLIDPFSLARP